MTPVGNYLQKVNTIIQALHDNFFFDTLDVYGCEYFEKLLNVPLKPGDSLENRRAKIQAKWLSNHHNSIALIQIVCDCWRNSEVEADFIGGKIVITFLRKYGVPADINSLKEAINEIKPAHIPYVCKYKYPVFRVNCARVNKVCLFINTAQEEEYSSISAEEEENEF